MGKALPPWANDLATAFYDTMTAYANTRLDLSDRDCGTVIDLLRPKLAVHAHPGESRTLIWTKVNHESYDAPEHTGRTHSTP